MKRKNKCPYCEAGNNDFQSVNQGKEYTGIEMTLSRLGTLRTRIYDGDRLITQDTVEFKYCPLCGKKFTKGIDD